MLSSARRCGGALAASRRFLSSETIVAPPMVYISGEEMTRYAGQLVLDKWISPHVDTSAWEWFDMSCTSRDNTNDAVLHDAVAAGARVGAIFKEPTVTPSEIQRQAMGLKNALGSPNGAMRKGWNGITISRDTIHIEGMELGFKRPVLFERHAVGGEYGAGWKPVGAGRIRTMFYPEGFATGEEQCVLVDDRHVSDEQNVAVTYTNPLDNVPDLAHHFFTRCLAAEVVPYVVTKKTVFKWQEPFWTIMKDVFDEHYREAYRAAGLLDTCGGELTHLISDAATMQIIRWTGGGFGMAAHNYDGDMLTDEVAQVHRSPGFITSNLIGKADDGSMIKEYEASHGTVADLWEAHLRGEETSFNPLGMVEALLGAMNHSADLAAEKDGTDAAPVHEFTDNLRQAMHRCMVAGQGTKDLCGPDGLSTEAFVDAVAQVLVTGDLPAANEDDLKPSKKLRRNHDVDEDAVRAMFANYDVDGDGSISLEEFEEMLAHLNLAPRIGEPQE
jgi:isocitrate dehydrogenase